MRLERGVCEICKAMFALGVRVTPSLTPQISDGDTRVTVVPPNLLVLLTRQTVRMSVFSRNKGFRQA